MTDIDREKLELITTNFVKGLLQHGGEGFEDLSSWADLARRLAEIIEVRQKVQHRIETDRRLMTAWGPGTCN